MCHRIYGRTQWSSRVTNSFFAACIVLLLQHDKIYDSKFSTTHYCNSCLLVGWCGKCWKKNYMNIVNSRIHTQRARQTIASAFSVVWNMVTCTMANNITYNMNSMRTMTMVLNQATPYKLINNCNILLVFYTSLLFQCRLPPPPTIIPVTTQQQQFLHTLCY